MSTIRSTRWRAVVLLTATVILIGGCAKPTEKKAEEPGKAPEKAAGGTPAERVAQPSVVNPQFAKSAQSVARADLLSCRNLDSKITQGSDATIAEFANSMNGVWLRRLTMHGLPIETNSFLYYAVDPNTGKGTAFMLDRVNLGPDPYLKTAPAPGPQLNKLEPLLAPIPPPRIDPQRVAIIEQGNAPGQELLLPSVLGALWDVTAATTKPTKNADRTQGNVGISLKMNGEYHGTGTQFPAGGINFTETAEFFKQGDSFVVVSPWVSPANGYGAAYSWSSVAASRINVAMPGGRMSGGGPIAGGGVAAPTASGPIGFDAASILTRKNFTFVNCEYEFLDTYVKLTDSAPTLGTASGAEALKAVFAKLKSSGALESLPGAGKVRTASPWP